MQSMEFSRPEEWVAIPFSRGSSQSRGRTQVSHIAGGFFTNWATREAQWLTNIEQVWKGSGKHLVSLSWIPSLMSAVKVLIDQLCLTLCNPMNQPGCSVHGILQTRILEWVAIPFSRGSSRPKDQTCVSCIAGGFFTIWATREACLLFEVGLIPSLLLCNWSRAPVQSEQSRGQA